MKFAHLADSHIGSWRDPKLKELSVKAFEQAIDKIIELDVDFLLIAGDLFNTSLPAVDRLKNVVIKLKELKDKNIPIYIIAGSHDFSPSGKTMLDVLESAGLFINVVKGTVEENGLKLNFTIDKKTNVKITGMLGKKGMLEKKYYEELIKDNLEKEDGYKIFMFHSAIAELKPEELKDMDAHPLSLLPKNFNYYAGGHVHYIFDKNIEGYGKIVYPGALFPNNFSELEKYGHGGFQLVTEAESKWIPIKLFDTENIILDCKHKSVEQVEHELNEKIKNIDIKDKIVLIRLFGTLSSGKPSDIGYKNLFDTLYHQEAYFVMKNTNKLHSKDFEQVKIDVKSVNEIESDLIDEHIGKIKLKEYNKEDEKDITKKLLHILNTSKREGERMMDFHDRIKKEIKSLL